MNHQHHQHRPILSNREYGNLIDPLLHQLIQSIIKQFILTWYSQSISSINSRHQPFIIQVQSILIDLIIQFEHRLSNLNHLDFLLIEIPQTLNLHLKAISTTNELLSRLAIDHPRPDSLLSFDQLFVRINRHPALQELIINSNPKDPQPQHHHEILSNLNWSSNPTLKLIQPIPKFSRSITTLVSPTYLRSLIESILQSSLPDRDWQPEVERYIIREIILNSILAPILYELTRPDVIYDRLIHLLQQPDPPAQQSPPDPDPEPSLPPEQSTLNPSTQAGFNFRSAYDQILILLNHVVHALLLLPAIVGSFIQLITTPAPIPTSPIDPHRLEPIIELISTLLGNPPHLHQLIWLLKLSSRFSHKLLTKIVAHLIFNQILSPIAISNLLIRINGLLNDLDPSAEEPHPITNGLEAESVRDHPHPGTQIDAGPDGSNVKKARLEDLLSSKLSTRTLKFLRPIKRQNHCCSSNSESSTSLSDPNLKPNHQADDLNPKLVTSSTDRDKLRFIQTLLNSTIDHQAANVALIVHLLDLFVIKLFPEILQTTPSAIPSSTG